MATDLSAPMSRRKIHNLYLLLTGLHQADADSAAHSTFLRTFIKETPEEYEFNNGVRLRRIGKDRFRIYGIHGDSGVIFYPKREIRGGYGY